MPFESFMFQSQIYTLFKELGKTKSLVLATDLFDLSMQNSIATNGSPTPEDSEHGASTILFGKAPGLPHPSSNGGKGAMLGLEFLLSRKMIKHKARRCCSRGYMLEC